METQAQPASMAQPRQPNTVQPGAIRNQATRAMNSVAPTSNHRGADSGTGPSRGIGVDNRISFDPMRPTDRYRLVVPYELRP